MGIIKIESAEQYEKLLSSENLSVILFAAEWAEQCSQILDVMRDLSGKSSFAKTQFIEIAAEDYPEISMKHQIDAVPTVLFVRNKSAVDRIDGVDVAALTTKCNKFVGAEGAASQGGDLNTRLKNLINKAPIMIFMKGDRTTPRCGFSKQLILILNDTGLPYETFDILSDEEVRQGLKTYSDWPTYPQVYVKGELIGGLDIIKELLAGGELVASLNG